MIITVNIEQNKIDRSMKIMKKKKTITLTLIGLFIFLFGIIGLTYAYWQLTLTQEDENLVYTDCLKLTTSLTETGSFTLTDAYPMTNNELVNDFFPNQAPYHFTITNECDNEVPISINMESLTTQDPNLKDEYVDVILWSDEDAESKFEPETDEVLSHKGTRTEIGSVEETPSYKLTENKKNGSKIIAEAKEAYQLYKFKIGANATKGFNLLLFMDYDTPVSTSQDITNNAHWAGKITLNNYELPKVNIGGINVQTVEEGDGLYAVEHTDVNIIDKNGEKVEGWQQTEYRYAGATPNNYVWFSCGPDASSGDTCEKWRIIGLVNVMTSDNQVEQRIKIIRDESIGNYSWDYKTNGIGSSIGDHGSDDWTDSQLMELLNDGYYNSSSDVSCYKGSSSSTKCDFTSTGLKESARDMIDKDIIWNLGGWNTHHVVTSDMYNYERGTTVSSNRPTEWQASNTAKASEETTSEKKLDSGLFRSIALPYPSDYGYATNGGTLGRKACFEKELSNYLGWGTVEYKTQCAGNDWLKPASGEMWFLSPDSSSSYIAFSVYSGGYVKSVSYVSNSNGVWPALYLSPSVSISGSTEDSENPIGSEQNPFILTME